MSMKLLVAGVVLTVLAIKTDQKNRIALHNEDSQAIDAASLSESSAVKRGIALVTDVFEDGLAKATRQSLTNSENTLTLLQPHISTAAGESGAQAKQLARDARAAIDNANKKLEAGKTFHALDYAMQASSRAGNLREKFERR